MPGKAVDYRTAQERAENNKRLRGVLRFAMGIIFVIYLGLGFSLMYVKQGAAEYYISIFTLGLNTLLFFAVLATSIVLKRRYDRFVQIMKDAAAADRADPWRIDERKERTC